MAEKKVEFEIRTFDFCNCPIEVRTIDNLEDLDTECLELAEDVAYGSIHSFKITRKES